MATFWLVKMPLNNLMAMKALMGSLKDFNGINQYPLNSPEIN